MKKDTVTRSISIDSELAKKIFEEVQRDCSSFAAVVRKILTEYFKDK